MEEEYDFVRPKNKAYDRPPLKQEADVNMYSQARPGSTSRVKAENNPQFDVTRQV